MSEDNEQTRRSVLNMIGGTAAAAGIGSAGLSRPAAAKTEDLEWAFPDGYVEDALTDLAERALASSKYDALRSKLSTRGYDVATDHATVVRKLDSDDRTSYVMFPLRDRTTEAMLGDLGPTPNGRVRAQDPVPESVTAARSGDGTPTIGHVVMSTAENEDAYAIRSASTTALTDGVSQSAPKAPTDGSGIEVVRNDEHVVHVGSMQAFSATAESTSGTVATAEYDLDAHTVTAERASADALDDVSTAGDVCPDSLSKLSMTLGGCGGSCGACASSTVGFWLGLIGCVGCAGCGCFLGCCLGELGGSAACTAADYASSPAGWALAPAYAAGATCVKEGCNGSCI